MNITFYTAMEWFQSICMILSLLFSLRLINNKRVVNNMKYFYWYSIVGGLIVALNILNFYFNFPTKIVMGTIRNYSVLFHFGFLSTFIISLLSPTLKKKVFITVTVPFFIISLIALMAYSNERQNSTAYALSNIGLVVLCINYFLYLFNNPRKNSLWKEPPFWIVSGIFLCMSAIIPINSLHEFLWDENFVLPDERKLLSSIRYFAFGCMHLFFIKAYLCSIRQEKV